MDVKGQQQKLGGKQGHLKRVLLLVYIITILLSLYNYNATISYHLYGVHQFISTRVMFLFCNAILLFLARDSGLLGSSKLRDNYLEADVVDNKRTDVVIDKSVAVQESVDSSTYLEPVMVTVELEREDGNELELAVVDELQLLGVDELNKRCEEFIGRMKMEISMSR